LKKEILVKKNTGDLQDFDESKLLYSLKRAGAGEEIANSILGQVNDILYPGIPTKKIYKLAFRKLRTHSVNIASQYKLKEALMEMGPSGYPFELLVGRLFEKMGFEVQVGIIVEGVCINHEVDVLAKKGNEIHIIECKFHNRPGLKSDVKVPLYIHSRYNDIVRKLNGDNKKSTKYKGWVVTNTRFTDEAVSYAKCSELFLMGWDYPEKNNLKERIGASGLYPITVLNKISKKEKAILMENGIIFCTDIIKNANLVQSLLFNSKNFKGLLNDAQILCDEK
jgi:hypothetical protein